MSLSSPSGGCMNTRLCGGRDGEVVMGVAASVLVLHPAVVPVARPYDARRTMMQC